MLNKAQIGAVLVAAALFLGLYFGLDARPEKSGTMDRSRAIQGEKTSVSTLITQAKSKLSESKQNEIKALEMQLESATQENEQISTLKKISAFWYTGNEISVAGSIAEEIAELENADSSWSVAGALFYTGLVKAQDPVERDFCAQHAVKSFENAASLAPEKPEHRVNLALVYAENPPPDNPMQAVLMLRELEKQNPEHPSVYNALGRLAIKTGQWQRAVDRLEKARSLDPKNPNTPCLLAKAYEGLGNTEKATEFATLCKAR